MRFRLIDAAKKEFPVQRLCKVLGVSQSGYFAWKDRPACRRQNEDLVLLAHIRSAFALSNATYGSPRMTRELRDDGITIGRHRVARLMRENALQARQRRRFKRTTDSLHAFPVAPNLLNQDFNAAGPNQKWGAVISYVWTREGWLYLAVVIDLFARRVVGWAAGDRLHKELALLALRRAVAVRCPPPFGPRLHQPASVRRAGSVKSKTLSTNAGQVHREPIRLALSMGARASTT